jgi:acyl-CoA synthetase (AMP-forming)/AMP-acid ligase II
VEYAGKQWYRTGDLVSADEHGVLTFSGRLKRFIKLGGEMISLPAVEAVLERAFPQDGEEGPALAVESTPGEHPELVLFATFDVERDVVNRTLREAGLSPLHNIRRVERVDRIPVLGTGKTDYRSLRARLDR